MAGLIVEAALGVCCIEGFSLHSIASEGAGPQGIFCSVKLVPGPAESARGQRQLTQVANKASAHLTTEPTPLDE